MKYYARVGLKFFELSLSSHISFARGHYGLASARASLRGLITRKYQLRSVLPLSSHIRVTLVEVIGLTNPDVNVRSPLLVAF